jgi:predicted outer membrane repeat protein
MKTLYTLLFLAISFIGHSATHLVTNTQDSGAGSLRDAVASANFGDVVKISPSLLGSGNDTIFLLSTINVDKGIFIEGTYNATDTIFISGSGSVQIFNFKTPHNTSYSDCYLDSLALIDGSATFGGAIELEWVSETSTGIMTIRDCYFANNQATDGGAIGSDATNYGSGGILEHDHTTLHIYNSTFKNNSATGRGGAIFIKLDDTEMDGLAATFTMTESTVYGNTAGTDGGGIYIHCDNYYSGWTTPTGASDVDVTILRSSICNNYAGDDGGGMWVLCDGSYNSDWGDVDLIIDFSTISDNTAVGDGGAIYCSAKDISDINLGYVTFTHNKAFNQGGSVYNISTHDKAELSFYSSIIALNTNAAGTNNNVYNSGPNNINTSTRSYGYNIFDDLLVSYYISPTSQPDMSGETDVTLDLDPLALNAMNTHSRLPGPLSVAVDAGWSGSTDDAQNMPIIGNRDIGAAESSHCIYYDQFSTETICAGDSYDFNGTTLTTSGTYIDTVVNPAGCDTIHNLTLTVNQNVTPTVTITCDQGNIVWPTTNCIFTASATNEGGAPTYVWRKNGNVVGSSSDTYNAGTVLHNDLITCELTSSETCVTTSVANSNQIQMVVEDNNDEPCSAITLPVNQTCDYEYYSNQMATNTAGVSDPSCATSSGNDVWFEFVAPPSGIVEMSTLAGTLTDAVLAVYDGTCSNLFEVGCVDDVGSDNMPEATLTGATPGETYFLRVLGWGSYSGTFAVCLWEGDASSTDNIAIKDYTIYPNPTNDLLYLNNFSSDATFALYSIDGKLLLQTSGVQSIDLSEYESGIYELLIYQNNEVIKEKVIKQ